MESVQQALVRVLLDHIRALGLISDFTCSKAVDLVYSAAELPEFFQYPPCLTEEAEGDECTQDTK